MMLNHMHGGVVSVIHLFPGIWVISCLVMQVLFGYGFVPLVDSFLWYDV